MYKFYPFIKYSVNGCVYENEELEGEHYSLELEVTDNAVKCVLHPKTEMKMLEFYISTYKKLGKDELFFSNGYQSWTTCYEFHATDKMDGMTPIANISDFTKGLAGISGDWRIAKYGGKGYFHSFTYTYFRKGADVELFGSLSERSGYTVFYLDANQNSFKIEKDVEGLVVSENYSLVDVVSFKGTYDEVFDSYFGSMNLRKPKTNGMSGYTSWYNYFQKIDEKIILRDLDGLDRAKDAVSIFQIDDGYESFVGDWLVPDSKKFPNGMKPIADAIHDKGYLAGIWLAPFSAQKTSVTAKEHPDWLIRDEKGMPLLGCVGWGGAYTLDFYNPEVQEYIKKFFDVVLHEWGFDMVKLDFLYSEAMLPRNGKTRGQIMCEAMDFLRECVGEDKLFLGCGVPLGPSFGVVDACRISCDVDLKYAGKFYNKLKVNPEIPSAQNAINNSLLRRHLNGRVFCNDPDVFFLRDNNLTFTFDQKLLLGKVNNICGNILFVSDNAGDYSDETIELVKKFFTKTDAEIISVDFVTADVVHVKFKENGKTKTLRFNMKTGKSNVKNVL
ncbi:MAG: alpha-galactosidase [Clostridia bacterium]|nr:alpha-galactosidase [Clostridia bacterium]